MNIRFLALLAPVLLPCRSPAAAQLNYTAYTFTTVAGRAGTTVNGGTNNKGAIFQVSTSGALTNIFSCAGNNGANPYGSLLEARDGNFYGTTEYGGGGLGTVFQLTPSGLLTTLGSFDYVNNGAFPASSLVEDATGNFYGTATIGGGGGAGNGTLFEIPATNNQVILAITNFIGSGQSPNSGLLAGPSNLFFGVTLGSVYQFTSTNGDNGGYPQGGVIRDGFGNLYGTTVNGGISNYGTVFRLDGNGVVTTLLDFTLTNGENPECTLTLDRNGNLWGTTAGGGPGLGAGTIFKVPTNGIPTNTVFSPVASFNGTNGSIPVGGLTFGPDGALYGTTEEGGPFGAGSIFRLLPTPVNPAPLNIQLLAGAPVITWTNPIFNLQASPTVTGLFRNVPQGYSPYTNTFYQLSTVLSPACQPLRRVVPSLQSNAR